MNEYFHYNPYCNYFFLCSSVKIETNGIFEKITINKRQYIVFNNLLHFVWWWLCGLYLYNKTKITYSSLLTLKVIALYVLIINVIIIGCVSSWSTFFIYLCINFNIIISLKNLFLDQKQTKFHVSHS